MRAKAALGARRRRASLAEWGPRWLARPGWPGLWLGLAAGLWAAAAAGAGGAEPAGDFARPALAVEAVHPAGERETSGFRDGPAQARALIRILPTPLAVNDPIRLGQIAHIESPDLQLAAQLAEVPVGRAPLPGGQRVLNVGTLRIRLRQAGLPERDVAIEAPAFSFTVRAAGLRLAGEELVRQAQGLWQQALAAPSQAGASPSQAAGELVLRAEGVPELVVPVGRVTYRLLDVPSLADRVTLLLEVRVDGQPVRTVPVRAAVGVRRWVPVAARDLPGGHRLGPGDVRWERQVVSPAVAAPAHVSELSGWELARTAPAGTVLTEGWLRPAADLRAGAGVLLVVEMEGLRVEAPGILLQDARWGDRVTARNGATGRLAEGWLEPGGIVRLGWSADARTQGAAASLAEGGTGHAGMAS